MSKKLSPKQFFLLLYLSTAALIVIPFLLSGRQDVIRVFYGLPLFLLPFPIIFATFFVVVAIPRARMALRRLEIPTKYSPKHFLQLLWLTAQALILDIMLHNGIYALGIACFGWGFWDRFGDEPVFFFIALTVVPAGLIAGAFGRLWDWCVVKPIEEMKAKGVQLPTAWPYFAPFASYGWLWKFGKGIEAITEGRIGARRVFASVFFLGIVGFVIIRAIIQRRLARVAA
ncbi:MAG: hypothetical protein JSW24_05145 [Dehalococcoidia bacterium]|nr:MAG: hypothetical protein JSW24_05145 [Dehalococcoidia bacterium]